MLGDLADAGGGVLAHIQVGIPEALEDVGEDLGLDDHLCEIYGVLRDLPQAAAHLRSIGCLAVGTCFDDDYMTRRLLSLRSLTSVVGVICFEDVHCSFTSGTTIVRCFRMMPLRSPFKKGGKAPPSPENYSSGQGLKQMLQSTLRYFRSAHIPPVHLLKESTANVEQEKYFTTPTICRTTT